MELAELLSSNADNEKDAEQLKQRMLCNSQETEKQENSSKVLNKEKEPQNRSFLQVEIWFPDENIFEVEFPGTYSIGDLLDEIAKFFRLDKKQWTACSIDGKIFSEKEIVRDILGRHKGIHLQRLRLIPKPKWG